MTRSWKNQTFHTRNSPERIWREDTCSGPIWHDADLSFRVNFEQANLKEANLENANLLKANLEEADLERSTWGPRCIVCNHRQAGRLRAQGDAAGALAAYQESEDVYRNIRRRFEALGLDDIAGYFFYGEMFSRRRQMRPNSPERLLSKFFDLLCGYGEKPSRIIVASWTFILFNSIVFFLADFQTGGIEYVLQLNVPVLDNLVAFGLSLYFSVVTYTTLGYGDFSPVGWSRPFAALEAYNGIILNTLFMLTFFRKMTR